MAISSIGSAAFPLLVSRLIAADGWRAAMEWIAGMIVFIVMPIIIFIVRAQPRGSATPEFQKSLQADGLSVTEALKSSDFWILTITQMLIGVSFLGIYTYIVPYLINEGYSADTATWLYAITNATSLGGYLIFGVISDRAGPKRALLLGIAICALSAPLLLGADSRHGAIEIVLAFAVLWGATSQLISQLAPVLLVNVVGLRSFGSIMGLNYFMYGLAMSAGPIVTGAILDSTRSYATAFALCSLLMLLALGPALVIRQQRVRTALTG
jgi:predicted MFS family arabinose efflux permease